MISEAVTPLTIGVPALTDHDVLTAVWQTGTAVILLQAGYLAGIATRFVMAAARSTSPSSASLQASSHRWPIRQGMQKGLSAE